MKNLTYFIFIFLFFISCSNEQTKKSVIKEKSLDLQVLESYKEGFKSGGVDNSALPTAALNPAVNGGDFSFLVYQSEESDGYEIGMKGNFLDGSMRLNATAFVYEYTDLQVQLFDSNTIQFQTFNASALETSGFEFDMLWQTNVYALRTQQQASFWQEEKSPNYMLLQPE